jgi:hypothetical protein
MIYKVVVTFSVTNGIDGVGEGKIPIGLVSIGFKGEYQQIKTKKQTFTYVPNVTIPTNVEDFGVLGFINQIQAKISTDFKKAPFIVSRAEHEKNSLLELTARVSYHFWTLLASVVV